MNKLRVRLSSATRPFLKAVALVALASFAATVLMACGLLGPGEPSQPATQLDVNPSGLSESELDAARMQMLELINDARRSAGLVEVVLDDNPAAQLHTEDMRANCFGSHWGSDGKKPYMRYTLNGGTHYTAENVSGSGYCPPNPLSYPDQALSERVAETQLRFMGSPANRELTLRPSLRKVGLGFSYQRPNLWVAQLFTSDHIQFDWLPMIERGILTFGFRLTNGAMYGEASPRSFVHYDPSPHSLVRGQLVRTHCVATGQLIAGIRPPAGEGLYWVEDSFETKLSDCPDPYGVAPDAPVPTGFFDPLPTIQPTVVWLGELPPSPPPTPLAAWITSEVWPLDGGGYGVRSDVSNLLERHGSGVYTLVIYATIDGESAPVGRYSIFVE